MTRYLAIERSLAGRWPESRIEPTLDRIRGLLDLLGDPQTAYPVIHLAGTNGKTSTARMVESLLRSFGLRTGLFTSPHLHSVRERIRIDGEAIDSERFVRIHDDIAPYVDIADATSEAAGGPRLSFFELMTAMAYAAFADAPVDVAVVETGMGGTWDATNVVDSSVAVVTPVDLDHREYLGPTIAAIAGEKAGIIKPGGTAVLAAQSLDAAEVLLRRCVETGATVAREGVEFGVVDRAPAIGGQLLTLRGPGGDYEDVLLPLFGAHQAQNAAVALAAVEAFLGGGTAPLNPDLVRQGFASVSSPGRLEVVRRSPTVLVDAAHNPHGARALAAAIADGFEFTTLVGVVAVLSDKDARGLLEALEPVLSEVVVTSSSSPRAADVDDLAAIAVEVFGAGRVQAERRLADALDAAIARADEAAADLGGGTGVLVTGSVVTAAEARTLLGRGEA
ncbi:MAG TPA: folylpolyglutamate synthase/dihydrofolate synthase family protein [Candidatus Angelobacter sp.]|nr:folylpolyglutamate synthase/dihydrofolate synthase family protein [Candidatus Angelobacter sp.]